MPEARDGATRAPAEHDGTAAAQEHRVVAFYLPQFHPVPENDEWWQPGFTEWTNVVRATPRFRGHEQPKLPGALGFYDLRLPETRARQAELARAHGIDAFCYYHYWFGGRRILERPFDEVLASGSPDFPFLLCWANENWSRHWNGGDKAVLLAQQYSEEDDRRHIESLLPAFADPRYVRIDGRPVFLVYRADELPDPARTIDVWREVASREGLDLYLCSVESSRSIAVDIDAAGFDAAVQFLPQRPYLGPRVGFERPLVTKVRRRLRPGAPLQSNTVYRYENLVRSALDEPAPPYKRYPCVLPGWDNSPRRDVGARIIVGSTPEAYGGWLAQTLRRFTPYSPQEDLVFVNAWNEWAEGAYLEPDERYGTAYLDATARARRAVGEELAGRLTAR